MNHADELRRFFEHLKEQDPEIKKNLGQLQEMRRDSAVQTSLESLADVVDDPGDVAIETIVSRVGRPVLEVEGTEFKLEGPETSIWQDRLGKEKVRAAIRKIIPAVGRIEVGNHRTDWVGTGWLVRDDIVVTNRHVAVEFATRRADKFAFRQGINGEPMTARIDFHEEFRATKPAEFEVLEVLHIEDDPGPDMAFLKVRLKGTSGKLADHLNLGAEPPKANIDVATIGYPAADSRIPDQELVMRLFGNVYNVKRLAPGQLLKVDENLVTHDCSTLGGNSGSPLFRLDTGEVVGLHFAGLFLRENRSVPAARIIDRLDQLGRRNGGSSRRRLDSDETSSGDLTLQAPDAVSGASGQEYTWTIPLQLTVKLGQPTLGPCAAGGSAGSGAKRQEPRGPRSAAEAVDEARNRVGSSGDVLNVREGYLFENGWITKKKAVVVLVKGSAAKENVAAKVPPEIGGQPVQVRVAGPWDYIEMQAAIETLEGVPTTAYEKPRKFKLEEVTEKMKVICHVSPDAGWPTLKKFLGGTKTRLTVGMYDFTAPHIIDAVEGAVEEDPRTLQLVLQAKAALSKSGVKAKDIPEEKTIKRYEKNLQDRLEFSWASVGKDRQFASAYHIKVAVQDGKAFWLSSGNWQSSNQPADDIDEASWKALTTFNREWHVVIHSRALARQYEKYIKYDFDNAADEAEESPLAKLEFFVAPPSALEARRPSGKPRYFEAKTFDKELRVMPLLTPDNYQEEALKLIKSAKKSVLFQNQSLSLLTDDKNDDRFLALAESLLEKQEKGLDVRIIMRGEFDVSRPLEQLQERGFDMDRVKLQDRCHTKGIIVDGQSVLIGSHNWTNQGALVNRDASLIFHDKEIAEYYGEVFEFDWTNLTRQSIDESREVVLAEAAQEVPGDMVRASWDEILLD